MTEEETILDGVSYISSKRASELTSYSQDYIGQLSRSGQIEARRVGGLWFVNLDSLKSHKAEPNATKLPDSAPSKGVTDPDTFVAFDGRSYISANRASKLSGYNQDYIGQLSRSGQILSRLVGNRWYVDQQSLLDHKAEKDALLAAVQREAVGIRLDKVPEPHNAPVAAMDYFSEEGDLMPNLPQKPRETISREPISASDDVMEQPKGDEQIRIPIRTSVHPPTRNALILKAPLSSGRKKAARSSLPAILGFSASALTIVIVFSLGFTTLKSESTYAAAPVRSGSMPAAVGGTLDGVLTRIEDMLVPKLVYRRTD